MKLAESMKHVLKSRSQNIFTDFWKDDLVTILKDFKDDFKDLAKSGNSKFKTLREQGFKETLLDIKDSAVDSVTIFKVIPKRLHKGFSFFRDDLIRELDEQEDSKQKTIFCLKVVGALSSFTLNTVYGAKKKTTDLKFSGLRIKNAFAQYLVMELVVKILKLFVLRFLSEVEKELDDDGEDKKKVRYFRDLVSLPAESEETGEEALSESDPAFKIVESLKQYILTGKRS